MSRTQRSWSLGVLAAVLVAAGAGSGRAQGLTGTLTGTVRDTTDAVLPGASVTLRNEASGDERTTLTNTRGLFALAALPAGTYTLRVELDGFVAWEQRGIVVHPGDSLHVSGARLGPGPKTEEVVVTAAFPLAPVDSGEKSATLTDKQIESIPILGRNSAELLKVLPGMAPVSTGAQPAFSGEVIGINGAGEGGNQSPLGNTVANGTRVEALDIVIDGAHAADPGCNCATPVNPNAEMVQELKVLQSNFSAEHSKGPVVVNIVSKAGGRDYHGSLYSHFRDYRLNANEWFLNKVGQPRVQNKFFFPGFTLGGPLRIPGTSFNEGRDKLFFFVGYEYYNQTIDTGVLRSYVPTDAMRRGDFSDASYINSLGGSANKVPSGFPGGVIPPGQIDPGGRTLLGLFPLPNVDPRQANGYNYVQSLAVEQDMTQLLARVDYAVSDNTKLFVRYNRQAEIQPFVVGLWWRNADQVPYPTQVLGENRSHSGSLSLTHVFNPTLTSETVFGVTYVNFPNRLEDPSKVSRAALGYPYQGLFRNGVDQIPSVLNWGGGAGSIFNPGGFEFGNSTLFAKKWLVTGATNFTKLTGAHTLKFGAFYEWVNNKQPGSGFSNGLINPGTTTGNVFADLLLGRVSGYSEQNKNVLHNMAYRTIQGYVQDSWKASARLTLDLGVRLAHLGGWYDREGIGVTVFDPARYDPRAPASALSGISARPDGVSPKAVFVQPRVGFAYDVTGAGRTVVRGGFGVFRYHDAQQPYDETLDLVAGVRSASGPSTLREIDATRVDPASLGGFNVDALDANDDQMPVTYSWSLTLQQRLPGDSMLELAYVGNKSDKLMNKTNRGSSGDDNLNLSAVNAVPLGGGPVPFPTYGSVDLYRHELYQNYHGLQVLLSRLTGRATYLASYTFSKTLGFRGAGYNNTSGLGVTGARLTPGTNAFAPGRLDDLRRANYGVLASDRTHVATLAYNLQLPRYTGGGLGRALLDGWEIGGVSTLMSGAPLQAVGNQGGPNFNFNIQGTLPDGTQITPQNINGSPHVPAMPVFTCDPRKNVPSGFLLNPACFAAPSPGQNGSYVFPDIRGPWYHNHDLTLVKNFSLGGDKRLQLRVSAYNFLNHPLAFPDTNNNLTLRFDRGRQVNPDFGRLPQDNKFGRRIVQLGVRFVF